MSGLAVARTHVSGTLPTQLARISGLKWLRLDHSLLSGTMPSQLGTLTELNTLMLGHNRISGVLPSQLAQLQLLRNASVGESSDCSLDPQEHPFPCPVDFALPAACLQAAPHSCIGCLEPNSPELYTCPRPAMALPPAHTLPSWPIVAPIVAVVLLLFACASLCVRRLVRKMRHLAASRDRANLDLRLLQHQVSRTDAAPDFDAIAPALPSRAGYAAAEPFELPPLQLGGAPVALPVPLGVLTGISPPPSLPPGPPSTHPTSDDGAESLKHACSAAGEPSSPPGSRPGREEEEGAAHAQSADAQRARQVGLQRLYTASADAITQFTWEAAQRSLRPSMGVLAPADARKFEACIQPLYELRRSQATLSMEPEEAFRILQAAADAMVNECAIPPQLALGLSRLVSSDVLHGAVYRIIASRFTTTAAEMPALLDRYRWPEPERTRVLQLLLGCLDAMRVFRAEVDAAALDALDAAAMRIFRAEGGGGGAGGAGAPDAEQAQLRSNPRIVRAMTMLRDSCMALGLSGAGSSVAALDLPPGLRAHLHNSLTTAAEQHVAEALAAAAGECVVRGPNPDS